MPLPIGLLSHKSQGKWSPREELNLLPQLYKNRALTDELLGDGKRAISVRACCLFQVLRQQFLVVLVLPEGIEPSSKP